MMYFARFFLPTIFGCHRYMANLWSCFLLPGVHGGPPHPLRFRWRSRQEYLWLGCVVFACNYSGEGYFMTKRYEQSASLREETPVSNSNRKIRLSVIIHAHN